MYKIIKILLIRQGKNERKNEKKCNFKLIIKIKNNSLNNLKKKLIHTIV